MPFTNNQLGPKEKNNNPLTKSLYIYGGDEIGLIPPSGFVFIIDNDRDYIIDNDDFYLVAPDP